MRIGFERGGGAMVKEAALKKQVDRYLKSQPGVWYLKVHGGPMQRAGVPDYLLCVRDKTGNGRFVAIELKGEGGSVSPLQAREIERIIAAGGMPAVCRSVDEVRRIVAVVAGLSRPPWDIPPTVDEAAKVGIIALVDEATGYQDVRAPDALVGELRKMQSDAK